MFPSSSSPHLFSSSLTSSFADQHSLIGSPECWMVAERVIQEILSVVQPTKVSDQSRLKVIDFVQRLIRYNLGAEVFLFGSVPLKTYLPDGDIDMTVVGGQIVEDDLAGAVCSILASQKQSNSEFLVKDIQCVPAQVKIVKCTVQNVAIDISFNQMDGLCSLSFLEKVDELIGRGHLFKRSIILTKAWCFYESRILGAHYGLISTYGLETLVLYIINLFHSSLHCPLSVLHKFLDYFSRFDWGKYCISLSGPVALSSLPELVVEKSENDGSSLLISNEFLQSCRQFSSVSLKTSDTGGQTFMIKHLNIIDPLRDNNNLGRSVGKGNFYRIRSALSYGAQSLSEILVRPAESVDEGLKKFFVNTLNHNGSRQRPDVQIPVPLFEGGEFEISDMTGHCESHFTSLQYGQRCLNYNLSIPCYPSPPASPSMVCNKNARVHYSESDNPPNNINDFVPRSELVYVPEIAPLSVQDMWNSRCASAHIPDSCVDRKLKLRGTGTFIPRVHIEENLMLQRVGKSAFDISIEGKLNPQSMGNSRPRVDVEEKLNPPHGTGTSRPGMDAYVPHAGNGGSMVLERRSTCLLETEGDRKLMSEGPGIRMHHLTSEQNAKVFQSYRQMHVLGKGKISESNSQSLLHKSAVKFEQVEASSDEWDKEVSSSCFNTSLEEFPPLPSRLNTDQLIDQQLSVQLTSDSVGRNPLLQQKGIKFVEFGNSPAPVASMLPICVVSTCINSMSGGLTTSPQGPERISPTEEQMSSAEAYRLQDEKDFPPLCR